MTEEVLTVGRQRIAQAAVVTEQAVSNWVRRHPGFPASISARRPLRYPAAAVADWLDRRPVPRDDLRHGEVPGRTFGERFREDLGLPSRSMSPKVIPRESGAGMWEALERRCSRSADPLAYQMLVMSLVCLRGVDLAGWTAVVRAARADYAAEVVRSVAKQQPEPLRYACDALDAVSDDVYSRRRLALTVEALSAELDGAGARMNAADAFTYLLDMFARYHRSKGGDLLTPAGLCRLMVLLVDPGPGDAVFDPYCRSGELLAEAARHARRSLAAPVRGLADGPQSLRLAQMNLAVHGMAADIGEAERRPVPFGAGEAAYDRVLVNPPFFPASADLLDPSPDAGKIDWPVGNLPSPNDDYAWLQRALSAARPGGVAAVVMPPRSTWATHTNARAARQRLVDAGVVRCVIALPGGLFRQTTIAVSVWILGAPLGRSGKDREILLIDATGAGRRREPTQRVLTDDDCEAVAAMYHGWARGEAHFPAVVGDITAATASPAAVHEHDLDLTPARYTSPEGSTRPVAPGLSALREELAALEAEARHADQAVAHYLERLRRWTR